MTGVTELTDREIAAVSGGEDWVKEQGEKLGRWVALRIEDAIDYFGPRKYRIHKD